MTSAHTHTHTHSVTVLNHFIHNEHKTRQQSHKTFCIVVKLLTGFHTESATKDQ